MTRLVFEIKTAMDFYKTFLENYQEYFNDLTSSRKAINCALTAWHLSEWVYHEDKKLKCVNAKIFQDRIIELEDAFKILKDIVNGTKHCEHSAKITTEVHKGAFSNGFSRDFDISRLVVKREDGTYIYFDNVVDKIAGFWKGYFEKTLIIDSNKNINSENTLSPTLFINYATDFYNLYCGISADNELASSFTAYFLLCRAIELALKAFLLEKGMAEKELKSQIGHDLVKAIRGAERNGLKVKVLFSKENIEILRVMNFYYKETMDFTYPRLGLKQYHYIYYVQRLARKCIFYVSKHICKEIGRPLKLRLNQANLKIDYSKLLPDVANRIGRDKRRRLWEKQFGLQSS